MKKALLAIVLLTITLTGCGMPKNLAEMVMYSNTMGTSTKIEWDGLEYYSLGSVDYSLIGEQVGFANGDKSNKIYEVKGYSSSEWLISSYKAEMEVVVEIFRERSVEDVPDEIEKQLPELFKIEKILASDGRYIPLGSGQGWNFMLDDEKLNRIIERYVDFTGAYLDNDFGKYIGNEIAVFVYETLPNNGDAEPMVRYAFAFVNRDLIMHRPLEGEEQFEFVKNVFNEVSETFWVN